jgi:hypothetical protein
LASFSRPWWRRRQRFLVIERSLGFESDLPLGRDPFQGGLILPEERDEVPDQRELHDVDLPGRCLIKQRLSL